MTWNYKLLPSLPVPPKTLLDQIDTSNIPQDHNIGYTGIRILEDWRGCNGPARRNMCRVPPRDCDSWMRQHICNDVLFTTVMYCDGAPDISSTGAHTDKVRNYVLIFPITDGGPDAEICFWQEKNHPVMREGGLARGRYSDLTLIDSIRVPANTWYLLNGQVLHSTENLIRPRINLQISFVELPDQIKHIL